ncbi:phage tail protein I [Methylobacter tundripaludum]|uniref:Phage tail protein I n=1 Tax=Methylobacter tundripaludum (strain ATCC BAA-1195 / DSM 17260 / SV96) TaxID=697282 RepID=G3IRF4_METTV|nr:phage tail protein I [Methylobacter tundripaludum]EGW22165.1 phage tail protein I [Methylobacter tundripaludum SV96]
MSSLLPPNANVHEHALDDAISRLGAVPVDIVKLWNPQTCPVAFLPWLAWALSVDEWDENWTEAQKRNTCAASYDVHSHKGTPHAIRAALSALGYDNIAIKEGAVNYYNGAHTYDGSWTYGADSAWPMFDVILNIGAFPDDAMVQRIRDSIERYKNKRSVLRNLIFMNLFYDGTWAYDGSKKYNGGVL